MLTSDRCAGVSMITDEVLSRRAHICSAGKTEPSASRIVTPTYQCVLMHVDVYNGTLPIAIITLF